MNAQLKNVLVAASMIVATQAIADVTFFERRIQNGLFPQNPGCAQHRPVATMIALRRRSSPVVVGNVRVCEHARYEGECVVLRPGRYPSLAAIGLNNQISSARPISRRELSENPRYTPYGDDAPDFRRVRNERLYEAEVVATRAVPGPKDKRCWVEKEQVVEARAATIAFGNDCRRSGRHHPGTSDRWRSRQGSGHHRRSRRQGLCRQPDRTKRWRTAGRRRRYGGCADVPNRSKPEYWDVMTCSVIRNTMCR